MANDPDQIARIEAYLSENLSPARFKHILGVRETAVALAKRHGIDDDQAELAALLHDCAKERHDDELLALAKRHGLEADEHEQRIPGLLHGKVAPFVAAEQFAVGDETVFDAMRCHSTGAVGNGTTRPCPVCRRFLRTEPTLHGGGGGARVGRTRPRGRRARGDAV